MAQVTTLSRPTASHFRRWTTPDGRIEALIILKDIWGMDGEEARDVILWAADLLVASADNHGR